MDLQYFLFIFFLSFKNLFNGKSYAVTENLEIQPLGVRVFKYVKSESIKHNFLSTMVQVLLHPQWRSRLELCRDTLFLSFVKMNVKAFATSNSPSKDLISESFPFTVTISSQANLYSSLLGQPMFLKAISHNKSSYLHTNNFRYVVRMFFSKKKRKHLGLSSE